MTQYTKANKTEVSKDTTSLSSNKICIILYGGHSRVPMVKILLCHGIIISPYIGRHFTASPMENLFLPDMKL